MEITNKRVLMSGASGFIGSALIEELRKDSAQIVRLVRNRRQSNPNAIYWNYRSNMLLAHPVDLEGFQAVVHLGGANIAQRWTEAYRKEIVRSRVDSTRQLCERLALLREPPKVLICASAVGIYGDRGNEVLTEESTPGSGFLADTCVAWEAATRPAADSGIRVVHVRFGLVLDRRGGALSKMVKPFRTGLGGRLGSGRQWMSWISLRDAVSAILFLMGRENLAGACNLTSPHPATNRAFTKALARALRRPAILPVPRVALRVALGAMADEGLLASCRAVPARLQQAGFVFQDEEIGRTLQALLR
jgi:uncharacterized protein